MKINSFQLNDFFFPFWGWGIVLRQGFSVYSWLSRTHSVDQAVFELRAICLPLLPSPGIKDVRHHHHYPTFSLSVKKSSEPLVQLGPEVMIAFLVFTCTTEPSVASHRGLLEHSTFPLSGYNFTYSRHITHSILPNESYHSFVYGLC
jgi:hypothetical protein